MAFDRNDAAHLLALKTEVTTDPIGMGYNLVEPEIIISLLNNPADNVAPESGPDFVTAERLLKELFPVSISSQDQFKIQLLFEISLDQSSDLSLFKPELSLLSNAIETAINGITRPLSRAEVLFSDLDANGVRESVSLTIQDWFDARDS